MSDQLSIATLLPWLAESAEARGETLRVTFDPTLAARGGSPWFAVVGTHTAWGETLQEALAGCWARLQRAARAEAARGRG